MSVSKLTKSTFLVLIASVFAAFGLGLYGSRAGMVVFAVPSAVSIGYLIFIVFHRVINPLVLLTSTMKQAREGGEGPGMPVEVPDDEFGVLAACCNSLYSELSETLDTREELFHSIPAPAMELDARGIIVSINAAAVRLGIPLSAKGKPLADAVLPGQGSSITARLEDALAKGPASGIELSLETGGGGSVLLMASAVALKRYGSRTGTLIVGRDCDETKRLEAELAAVRSEARAAEDKLTGTIRDLEDFALMAVRREIKMKEIREKLTELREGHGVAGGAM